MADQLWAHRRYVDAAEAEIARFAVVVRDAGPRTPVPTCPGWSVADLVAHLGRTHRWAGGMVARLSPRRLRIADLDLKFPADPADPAGYLPWFEDGGSELVATLRTTDADAAMWTWGADRHARWWCRRMLHETLVHRCDAEFAAGLDPVVDEATAADGIDELLGNLPSAVVFAPQIENLRGAGETIALISAEDRWLITLGPDGFGWERDGDTASASASVRGAASDLNLFLWGRRKLGDPRLAFGGDEGLLIHWVEHSAI